MIIVRSPLRISFAGGGTDFRDYYCKDFGAVCSLAINKYVYVTINNLSDYFPHRIRVAYSQTELTQDLKSIKHPIVRESLKEMKIEGGIDINVMADIPAGTGMGSSSTFTVSLLHALHSYKHNLISKENLAKEASILEIDRLREPIGKQDQYAASFGGLNLFKFLPDESVAVQPIPLSETSRHKLLNHLMLFYIGGNRQASTILQEQNSKIENNRTEMNEMRDQAIEVAQVLSRGGQSQSENSFDEIGKILLHGWKLKKSLAQGISNADVDNAMNLALNSGAIGGKLLGAGGTGFILLYVPLKAKENVRSALSKYPEIHFESDLMGSTLLYYGG